MASLLVGAPPMASKSLSLSSTLRFSPSKSLVSVSLPTRSVSLASPAPRLLITCGRGDKKTARGKRFNHSFGNVSSSIPFQEIFNAMVICHLSPGARPRNKKKGRGPQRVPAPPAPPRKDPFDDDEKIEIELDDSPFE
ncbi:hypothetical protein RHSIM_Rhsim03G0141800 [Rhododendron simsii]|uniref:30S ribosomal protein S31, chloroplastic n=1 Tax=Rhododendron simsii TaxID=118357 RepID=A0A834HBF9_RHOSS|nr:hypothetical protein RHSIM_Rhsim03G0141800 [Rhododendron simsii]